MQKRTWLDSVKEEWLLVIAALGLLLTSLYLRRWPAYSRSDLEVLYILWMLFIITTGLRRHGVLGRIAVRIEQGRWIAAKLVVVTFLFSMLVTNDVALLAIVPLTMLLHIEEKAWLVILEALAANAGSALSPFGNPQNLFIYWHYGVPFPDFVRQIAPFAIVFLAFLSVGALALRGKGHPVPTAEPRPLSPSAYFYLGALALFTLVILRVLPLYVGLAIIAYVLVLDRGSLRVDYFLLATFACFFGFTDNLRILLAGVLAHPHHTFLLAALLSQLISNVPTALLLADFTPHWHSLLWGVSVGGFGNLIASLANLIAYRLYVRQERHGARGFLIRFHVVGYLAFLAGVILYALIHIY